MKAVPKLPKPKGDTSTISMLVYEYHRYQRNALKNGWSTDFESFIEWLEGEGYF